jgi:hypothetical protein
VKVLVEGHGNTAWVSEPASCGIVNHLILVVVFNANPFRGSTGISGWKSRERSFMRGVDPVVGGRILRDMEDRIAQDTGRFEHCGHAGCGMEPK